MEIEITPTKKLTILGVDRRSLENLLWCSSTYGVNRLFWIDGYLLCIEVFDKSFEHEIKTRELPVTQICYVKFPKYTKFYEVEKGVQLPIVNVSDMRMFKQLLKAILENKEKDPAATSSSD